MFTPAARLNLTLLTIIINYYVSSVTTLSRPQSRFLDALFALDNPMGKDRLTETYSPHFYKTTFNKRCLHFSPRLFSSVHSTEDLRYVVLIRCIYKVEIRIQYLHI